MSEFDEIQAFAVLLANLGRKKRGENLLKIAEQCIHLKERYNSWTELAKRIIISDERPHISAEMLREFGTVLELPDEIKKMIKDDLITSVDIAYRISLLQHDKDQISLAKAVAEKKLSTSDVRGIVEYKIKNPGVTIDEAIQKVLQSKPKVVTHHIVIMELSEETLEKLRKKAEKLRQTPDNLALTILSKKWDKEWILSFGIRGNDIIIKLSEDGFEALQKEARVSDTELKDLAEKLIQNVLQSPR